MGYDTGSLDGPKFYVVVKKRHNNLYYRRPIMDKYIGFDIDSKKTIACVVQRGKKDRFTTLKTRILFLASLLFISGYELNFLDGKGCERV